MFISASRLFTFPFLCRYLVSRDDLPSFSSSLLLSLLILSRTPRDVLSCTPEYRRILLFSVLRLFWQPCPGLSTFGQQVAGVFLGVVGRRTAGGHHPAAVRCISPSSAPACWASVRRLPADSSAAGGTPRHREGLGGHEGLRTRSPMRCGRCPRRRFAAAASVMMSRPCFLGAIGEQPKGPSVARSAASDGPASPRPLTLPNGRLEGRAPAST